MAIPYRRNCSELAMAEALPKGVDPTKGPPAAAAEPAAPALSILVGTGQPIAPTGAFPVGILIHEGKGQA